MQHQSLLVSSQLVVLVCHRENPLGQGGRFGEDAVIVCQGAQERPRLHGAKLAAEEDWGKGGWQVHE